MATPSYPEDLGSELNLLRAKVRSAFTSANARKAYAEIRSGSIEVFGDVTVRDGGQLQVRFPDDFGGGVIMHIGDIFRDDTGAFVGTGMILQREDAGDILVVRTDEVGGSRIQARDGIGNVVLGTDDSGTGLAHPFLRAHPAFDRVASWPSSPETVFTPLVKTWSSTYQPWVRVFGNVIGNDGGAGEARVMCNGVQIGSTISVSNNVIETVFVEAPIPNLPSNFEALIDLASLEVRRTSGSGIIRGQLYSVETRRGPAE